MYTMAYIKVQNSIKERACDPMSAKRNSRSFKFEYTERLKPIHAHRTRDTNVYIAAKKIKPGIPRRPKTPFIRPPTIHIKVRTKLNDLLLWARFSKEKNSTPPPFLLASDILYSTVFGKFPAALWLAGLLKKVFAEKWSVLYGTWKLRRRAPTLRKKPLKSLWWATNFKL